MLILSGTVPKQGLPLLVGEGRLTPDGLMVDGHVLEQNRGTAAMMTTVTVVCKEYNLRPPLCVVAGDIGTRDGSNKIYEYLIEHIAELNPLGITSHYIMPDIRKNNKLIKAIQHLKQKPVLIADAGFM